MLLEVVDTVCSRVRAALAGGRSPLLYGADCAVLLDAVPMLADVLGEAGLVLIDGLEDAAPERTIGPPLRRGSGRPRG